MPLGMPSASSSRSGRPAAAAAGRERAADAGADDPVDRARVGVDQQLRRVEQQAFVGGEGPGHPVAVALPGPDARQVPVPDEPGPRRERPPLLTVGPVEQAELDRLRMCGEEREGRSLAVPARAERKGPAGLEGQKLPPGRAVRSTSSPYGIAGERSLGESPPSPTPARARAPRAAAA